MILGRFIPRYEYFIKQKEKSMASRNRILQSILPGLRFVCELEQGKETVRMDKVNQALAMFGMEAVPGRKDRKILLD